MTTMNLSIPPEIKQAIQDDNEHMVVQYAKDFEKTGNWHGYTLLSLASKAGSMKTLKALMSHYPNKSWNVYTYDLKEIIQYGTRADNALEVIMFLWEEIEKRRVKEIQQGKNACDMNSFRNAILIASVKNYHLDLTAFLLDNGADMAILEDCPDKPAELDQWLSKYRLNKDLQARLTNKDHIEEKRLKI